MHLAADWGSLQSQNRIEIPTHRQHLILYTLITPALVCMALLSRCNVDGVDQSALQSVACLFELIFVVLHYNNRAITTSDNNIVMLQYSGCRFGTTDTEQGHDGHACLSQHVVAEGIDLGWIGKDSVCREGE